MVKCYWRYFLYVIRHKWFVFHECLKLGVPFYIALMHDWDKFLPDEFIPYAHHFGGYRNAPQSAVGYIHADDMADDDFNAAVERHIRRNKHHWEFWNTWECAYPLSAIPRLGLLPAPMPDVYCREMIADWRGAGRAQGTPDNRAWYLANKGRLVLHPITREQIEKELKVEPA